MQAVRTVIPACVMIWSLACVTVPANADSNAQPVVANTAILGGNAFANAVGLLRVNQAAGTGNQQSNTATILSGRSISDAILAGATSQVTTLPLGKGISSRDRVIAAPGVFTHASGVVQINQTAGEGNASANVFALRIHP